jgi:hypothetical protein
MIMMPGGQLQNICELSGPAYASIYSSKFEYPWAANHSIDAPAGSGGSGPVGSAGQPPAAGSSLMNGASQALTCRAEQPRRQTRHTVGGAVIFMRHAVLVFVWSISDWVYSGPVHSFTRSASGIPATAPAKQSDAGEAYCTYDRQKITDVGTVSFR